MEELKASPSFVAPGIICAECGKAALRTGPVQKYCRPCSEKRDLIRKGLWVKENPQKPREPESVLESKRRRRAKATAVGKAASVGESRGITWFESGPPDLAWLVRVSVPFTYRISKNALFGTTRRGHVYLREEARAARESVVWAIRRAMRDQRVVNHKLWIDILVQKPNHKGDAVNVLDSVCDGIKKAIPLDDRWYCIRRVDWQIVKENPRLFIGIGQESAVDSQACSVCGRILAFGLFGKNAANKHGVGRECLECRGAIRKKPKRARRGDDSLNPRVEICVEESK